MKTRVVNIRFSKYDCYVGRAGRGEKGTHGNPYTTNLGQSLDKVVNKLYREHFYFKVANDSAYAKEVDALVKLKKKNGALTLGCFCAVGTGSLTADDVPFSCHGQVIAEYIDARCP